MKKLYYLIILTVILGLVLTGCFLSNVGQVPTTEQSGITYLTKHTESDPFMATLFAGKTIDVGTVKVWNDHVNLYVKYETTGGWVMTETHLEVVTEFGHFPTNNADNPKVGHFQYGEEDIFTETWEKIITLEDIPAVGGGTLYIAAHAKVINKEILGDEMVANGSFENPSVAAGDWDIFPSDYDGLGWTVEWRDNDTTITSTYKGYIRPSIANLEIHNGIWSKSAAEGQQWTELDSDWFGPPPGDGTDLNGEVGNTGKEPSSVKIYQDLITIPGAYYKLSFAFSGRDQQKGKNRLGIYWNSDIVDDLVILQDSEFNWNTYTYFLNATSDKTCLEFIDLATSDSFGTLLDAVSVKYVIDETAWAVNEDEPFTFPGRNWATYFTYTVQAEL